MYSLIIADDEAIERKALEIMILNAFPEISLLPSVANGAELVKAVKEGRPDIAIVDINMPLLTGLEAIELIRAENKELKIIISSAYSEFEYARTAMNLGASDYILKPLEKEVLESTLTKLLGKMDRERSTVTRAKLNEQNMDEMTRMVGHELLSSVLLGEPNEKSFQLYRNALKQEFRGVYLATARLSLKDPGMRVSRDKKQEFFESMIHSAASFCQCVGKIYKDELYLMLFPGSAMTEERPYLTDILNISLRGLPEELRPALEFGVSRRKNDCEELSDALSECLIAVRRSGQGKIRFFEAAEKKDKYANPYGELGARCLEAFKNGQGSRCEEWIHEEFQKIPQDENILLSEVQMQILDALLPTAVYLESIQDWRTKYHKKAKFEMKALQQCSTPQDLENWICETVQQMASVETPRDNVHIQQAILYMEQHFREDISLEETAEHAEITPFYLSRLMKQELSRTFVDVLTDIRMREALRLLWERTHSVKEIAALSGYNDTAYFYRVFKKTMGINIGEMKKYLELLT